MTKKSQLQQTLKLAIPIIISQLGQLAYGLMDSAMIGKISTVQLSASAFVNNVFNIPFVFLAGITSATSVLVSKEFGAKNYKSIFDIVFSALIITTLLSLTVIAVLEIIGAQLEMFHQPHEVLSVSKNYYKTIIWSALPFALFFVLKHFCEAISKPAIPTFILFLGLGVNFILNDVLIHGKYGFPRLEIDGAGIATLVSRWVCVLILGYILLTNKNFKIYFHRNFKIHIQTSHLVSVLKVGVPSGFQYLFEVMAFAGAGIMMGWISTESLAAHQIAIQIASATFMFALGLSFATAVRIGQYYGQENYLALKKVGFSSLIFVASSLFIFGAIILLIREWIPTLFVNDPQVIEIASQLFIVVFFFQIFDGTQAVSVSALRALSDVRVPTAVTFIGYWVITIPLAYFLGFHTPLKHLGIWVSLGIGLAVVSVVLVLRFFILTNSLIQSHKQT